MDDMTQRLDHLNVSAVNACASSPPSDSCGSFDHVNLNCQVGSLFAQSSSHQVAYVNKFHTRLNHDPYYNIYNPAWKKLPNLSCKSDSLPFP